MPTGLDDKSSLTPNKKTPPGRFLLLLSGATKKGTWMTEIPRLPTWFVYYDWPREIARSGKHLLLSEFITPIFGSRYAVIIYLIVLL
jgi:hypothetical protein